MKLTIGKKYYRRVDEEPWTIIASEGPRVQLKRGLQQKWILDASMQYGWIEVGSARDLEHRKTCRRFGWKIWNDNEEKTDVK